MAVFIQYISVKWAFYLTFSGINEFLLGIIDGILCKYGVEFRIYINFHSEENLTFMQNWLARKCFL
jgi:hypothetical protein